MYSSELSGVEMYTFTYIHRSMHLDLQVNVLYMQDTGTGTHNTQVQ